MAFLNDLKKRARKNQAIIAFPEYTDHRIIEAAMILQERKLAIPVIIGDPKKIPLGFRIIDSTDPETQRSFVEYYQKLRARKSVTKKELDMIKTDTVAHALMLLHAGTFDAVITGADHSTVHTLRHAFRIIGLQKGVKKASSYFIMDKHAHGEDVKIFSDCAVQINPNARELAEIAHLTAHTSKNLGLTPRIALLSFSTHGSAQSEETRKVRKALTLLKKKEPSLISDGEIQFDAAVDPQIAKKKGSTINGNANVFIFPTLDAGNIGYKIMRIYGKYEALGPFIQGLRKPVIDLSRGCNVQEIVDIATVVSAISDAQ